MPVMTVSNMAFRSNLQPVGDEEFRDSVFLTKIRDAFALDYMHRQKFKMLPVQEEEYQKASSHCSYAFDKDYPWGTILDENGNEVLTCKCQNMQCSRFRTCNPDFELKDLKDLIENDISSYLKYIDNLHRVRPESRQTVRTQELEEAYRKVLCAAEQIATESYDIQTVHPEESSETGDVRKEEMRVVPEEEITEVLSEEDILLDDDPDSTASEKEKTDTVSLQKPEVPAEGFGRFVHAEYEDVLLAGPEERMLINAGPGTGKTWTLIHKLQALVKAGVSPEKILVLSFSRAAVEEIEKRLKQAEQDGKLPARWHSIEFCTLDSFATRMILFAMKDDPSLLKPGYSLTEQGYDERIETARKILEKAPDFLEPNVHVLIDEIQDLVGCRAQLVLDILMGLSPECGFTLLGDACQSLYDYQAEFDSSILSSAQFYDRLFRDFPDIRYYRFDENHRQNEWLRELITPYRDAILTGTAEVRRDTVFKIRKETMKSFIDLNRLETGKNPFEHLLKSGSVAILTRSNGEALKISEYLKSAEINHRLGRPDSEEQMNDWIATVFTQYPDDSIKYDLFSEYVVKLKPDLRDAGVESCWKALIENVQKKDSWYEVRDLLNAVLRRGKNRALFRYATEESGLTVSNIHRAKGKEYDMVLVPEYLLDELIKSGKDLVNEHKVCYVACTRPRSSLKTIQLKKVYVSRDRKTGRCFEGKFKNGKKGQRYLACMEVGLSGDIDVMSLANEETQRYIRDVLKEEDRILLRREISGDRVRYSIRPENEPERVLGYMSAGFSNEVARFKRFLSLWKGKIDSKYYPPGMDNIMVTKKTSCIVTGEKKQDGMRYYGDIGIWFGFSLTGFAHMDYTNIY